MRYLLAVMMIGLLASSALAQDRRDRGDRFNRDRDRSSNGSRSSSSASSSASPVNDDNPDLTKFDRYQVLSEHNIFVKNRVQRSRGPTTRETSREGPRRPETAFVLRGCVIEDEQKYAAFVENIATGVTRKVTVGEEIATGKVVAIGFDYLEYESSGQRTPIKVGDNFTGTAATTSSIVTLIPTTGPTSGPVDESNLSMLEKLKLKRAREEAGFSTPSGGR